MDIPPFHRGDARSLARPARTRPGAPGDRVSISCASIAAASVEVQISGSSGPSCPEPVPDPRPVDPG
ncbi:MAG TPA: hypothetical protein VGD37_25790 [Kofleriaceae bacterium]